MARSRLLTVPGGRGVVPVWLADGRLVVLVVEPHGRPGGTAATLFVISGHRGTRATESRTCSGMCSATVPAELADSYEQVMTTHSGSVVVRVGSHGRMGIAQVDIDTGAVGRSLTDNDPVHPSASLAEGWSSPAKPRTCFPN